MNYEREPANMKEMGPKAYNQKIKRSSKEADDHKNLPFNFDKPRKAKPSKVGIECKHCKKAVFVTEDAVLVVCGSCSGITRIKDKVKK